MGGSKPKTPARQRSGTSCPRQNTVRRVALCCCLIAVAGLTSLPCAVPQSGAAGGALGLAGRGRGRGGRGRDGDRRHARDVSKVEHFLRDHEKPAAFTYHSTTLPNFYAHVTSATVEQRRAMYGESNVVFVHQNKAAGSTVKGMLEARCTNHPTTTTCHDSGFRDYQAGRSWQLQQARFYDRRGVDPSTQFVDEGCYSWGMCDVLTGLSPRNCSYVTMFRDPKERLVSAFIYCIYKQPKDQCCGWNRFFQAHGYDKMPERRKSQMRANASVVDFARHWGSFGFRQFLINDEAIGYERIVAKIFAPRGLDNDHTPEGRMRLAAVTEQIRREVAVVGIVERWNETVDLLRYAYGWQEFAHEAASVNVMPDVAKARASHSGARPGGGGGGGPPVVTPMAAYREIEFNEEVAQLLSADQALYDAALAIFEKQMGAYHRLVDGPLVHGGAGGGGGWVAAARTRAAGRVQLRGWPQ